MVQALQARDGAQAVVWDEVKVKAEAEWVDRTPPVRVAVVYARTVRPSSLTWPASLAMEELVRTVVQK